MKDNYAHDKDFGEIWKCCQVHPIHEFYIQSGFLFKNNKLCIPDTLIKQQIPFDAHAGGLEAHLGREKTIDQLVVRFHWPHLHRDVTKFIQKMCNMPKF